MDNLICNAKWELGEDGSIPCFSDSGPITRDCFCWNGCHTCSLTLEKGRGNTACSRYELPICVSGQCDLVWGYTMRVIDACCIILRVKFCDACGNLINVQDKDITCEVGYEFNRQSACFHIPCTACMAFVSLHFEGKTTACTFTEPFAYFCS